MKDALTNEDMLAWFDASERTRCGACGETAAVSAGGGSAAICLACGAVWATDGERLDVRGGIARAAPGDSVDRAPRSLPAARRRPGAASRAVRRRGQAAPALARRLGEAPELVRHEVLRLARDLVCHVSRRVWRRPIS